MEIRRFFASPNDLSDDKIVLYGDEFLHMTKVLRYKSGFLATVCLNDGCERLCRVDNILKDKVLLSVLECKSVDKKNICLDLYAGLLKNQKLDFAVQKGVELGVDSITPFVSQNTAENKFNADRSRKIVLESAKQCGSAYLTQIEELIEFDCMLKKFNDYDLVLFSYECEKYNTLAQAISDFLAKSKNNPITKQKSKDDITIKVALVVGSEGGFTASEVEAAKNEGAKIVTLGKRVLRAETADIVAAALTLFAFGELDYD